MAQNVREGQSQPTDSRQYQPGEESNGILQGPTSQPRRIGAHFPSDASYFQVARNVVATSVAGHLQPSRNEERTQNESSRPAVRTLPAWIRSFVTPDDEIDAATRLLPAQPNDAIVAQHNHSPHSKQNPPPGPGDRDSKDLTSFGSGVRGSRWAGLARSVAYPRVSLSKERTVDLEWLDENLGDYSQPWTCLRDGGTEEGSLLETLWIKRFQSVLLKSPIIPLAFRLTVWFFSLIALALGGTIHHLVEVYGRSQGPSADMAIVVDAVALVYLVYITWDEYTGKPLGLRSPNAKIRLIFLDIFFIVFDSANLSLAFASLSDVQGSCASPRSKDELDSKNDAICSRQAALVSVLLIALVAWLLTFGISVFRLVERVVSK